MIPELGKQIAAAIAADQPLILVLAGSNGAGKSTYYRHALRETGLPFINADEIAKDMRPADPGGVAYEAMHRAEAVREAAFSKRQSFIMETVLSDPQGAKLAFFKRAQDCGYSLIVIFIRIADVEISRARVIQRVADGGHDVPDDKLSERFARTAANAHMALAMADLGIVLDNSKARDPYQHVETWICGECIQRDGRPVPRASR